MIINGVTFGYVFSPNWMGAIQVPFYSKNCPTKLISIESCPQVTYFIERIPRRIIYIYRGNPTCSKKQHISNSGPTMNFWQHGAVP